MELIPLSSDPLLERLDEICARLRSGYWDVAEMAQDDARALMGDVAVAALDALIEKYGVGFNTGQLKLVPDEGVRRFLRERFGGGSGETKTQD